VSDHYVSFAPRRETDYYTATLAGRSHKLQPELCWSTWRTIEVPVNTTTAFSLCDVM
jgi:hypothetical protein